MSGKTKAQKSSDIEILNMKGVSISLFAPYCTAEEWSERTGISVRGVKEQLKKGKIVEFQRETNGAKYVNVLAEMTKMLEVKPW